MHKTNIIKNYIWIKGEDTIKRASFFFTSPNKKVLFFFLSEFNYYLSRLGVLNYYYYFQNNQR